MSEETSQTPPITRQPRRQRRAAPTGAAMFTADSLQSILNSPDMQTGSTASSTSPDISNITGSTEGAVTSESPKDISSANVLIRPRRRRVRPEGLGEQAAVDFQGGSPSLFSITSSKSAEETETDKSKDPLGASLASVRRARSRVPTATDFAAEDGDEDTSRSSGISPMRSDKASTDAGDFGSENITVPEQDKDIADKSTLLSTEESTGPAPDITRPRRRRERAAGRNFSTLSKESEYQKASEITGIDAPTSTEHENLNFEKNPLMEPTSLSDIKIPDEPESIGKNVSAPPKDNFVSLEKNANEPISSVDESTVEPKFRQESLGILPLGLSTAEEAQLPIMQRSKSVPPSMAATLLHEEVEAAKGEQLALEKQLLSKKLEKLSLNHRNLQNELSEKSAEISSLVAAKLLLETEKDMILNKAEAVKPITEEMIELKKEVAQWKSLAEQAANILEIWQDAYKDILPSETYLLKIMEESGQTITEDSLSELAKEYRNLELDPSFFALHRREVLLKSHLSHLWGKSVDLMANQASVVPVSEDPNQMVDLDGVEISRDALLLLQELDTVKERNASLCKILKSDEGLNEGLMPF